jgi:hypothetical protein
VCRINALSLLAGWYGVLMIAWFPIAAPPSITAEFLIARHPVLFLLVTKPTKTKHNESNQIKNRWLRLCRPKEHIRPSQHEHHYDESV